ncbi:hypothetical protein [uncultured Nitratireductor sp.]|nr:hypothetical protein [uncultured Nitratireductor sp.]
MVVVGTLCLVIQLNVITMIVITAEEFNDRTNRLQLSWRCDNSNVSVA